MQPQQAGSGTQCHFPPLLAICKELQGLWCLVQTQFCKSVEGVVSLQPCALPLEVGSNTELSSEVHDGLGSVQGSSTSVTEQKSEKYLPLSGVSGQW